MVGRNDPCPCGSGKKYKKCCLPREEASRTDTSPDRNFEALNQTEEPELVSWKAEDRQLIRKGMALIDGARADTSELIEKYWGPETRARFQREGLSDPEIQQSSQWLWLDWRRTQNSKTIAEQMTSDPSLTEKQRQLLASMNSSHMSVYQVVRLDPGRGVELENALEGGRLFVHDRAFSSSAEKWLLLFCRVYTAGPYNFMAGGGYSIPPREKEFIKAYLTRELQKYQRNVPGASWGEFLKMRPEVLGRLTVELHKRAMELPSLRNADGDTLVFCKACFTVGNPDEFLAALRKHPELEEDAQKEDQQSFVWFRRVKDESLALGHIVLAGSKLEFECNSKERLSRGTRLLQESGDLELVEQETKDGKQLLEEARKTRKATPPLDTENSLETLPEVQAYIRESLERHYEDWVNHPLPALDGQTPRQAARSLSGRKKLIDLLREMEFGDRRKIGHSHLSYDWNKLRRRLGLAEE